MSTKNYKAKTKKPENLRPIEYKAKVIAKYGLNVRKGPSVSYDKVREDWVLACGEEVTIYEEKDGWGKIDPINQYWSDLNWLEKE